MIAGGIWRLQTATSSSVSSWVYTIYSYSIQVFYSTLVVSLVVEFVVRYRANNMEGAIENLSKTIFGILLMLKLLLCQSNKLVNLTRSAIKEEEEVFKKDDKAIQTIYKSHVRYSSKITYTVAVYSFLLGGYLIEIGITNSYLFYKAHKGFNVSLEKPLPMPLWYPFDRNKYHVWALVHQIVEVFLTALYSGSVQAFTNAAIIFVRSQLKILQYLLANFDAYSVTDEFLEVDDVGLHTLKVFLRSHHKLIIWMEDLDNSFKELLLIEYIVSSLLLAAVIMQIFAGKDAVFHTIYLMLIFLQLVVLAWNADEVKEQSANLANALYNSSWYKHSQQVKVFILVMMMRCQKPLTLSIGPFGAMTADAALSISG
ncbi:odorant receptor 67c-like isoform X2 [Cylas formicarius]|uniref:odorant receptor 67c-like isoform X2 n=1 Tax=Cylas formicarius TaxID=197179 RepID=UPI0029589E6B|nr:odorant receptor 67c-like isoform X2 [Cylas formicarius]